MPFASSASAMNAAATAKVAPCSACAGPNTAPRNECAIMMWSDTSTANTIAPPGSNGRFGRVTDQWAQHAACRLQDIRQPDRQVVKRNHRAEQRIERRVGEQLERRGETPARRPAHAVRGRDAPDLARHQTQAAAVEGPS